MILQGPSGKGEYNLQESTETQPQGIGSGILHDNWLIIEEYGQILLRYKDSTLSSHWVATKALDRWEIWWYSPNPANMEDLVPYFSVDIELVEAGNAGKDEL